MFTRRHLQFSILPLAVLTLALWASPAGAQNRDLFNNFNVSSIAGPNAPIFNPVFTLPGAARITELVTYHWNNGQGATPGTISLRDQTNRVYGPFAARGESGQGGAPNVNWVATVNLTVPAGTFIVFDSEPGTWSRNAQPPSFYRGFVIVRGQFLQGSAPLPGPLPGPLSGPRPPAPSACPPAYPNCTCRGAGCVHPDLTAFGGNGPLGATAPRRVHVS
ncbi:MAG: hypothetical protein DMF60_13620, partial [Acidobacteria bacterium]